MTDDELKTLVARLRYLEDFREDMCTYDLIEAADAIEALMAERDMLSNELDLKEQEDCSEENYLQSELDTAIARAERAEALVRELWDGAKHLAWPDEMDARVAEVEREPKK